MENYEIDSLDLHILEALQKDARTPFIELARKLVVSGGTIHQRVDRLKTLGIIKGYQLQVDYSKLGLGVSVLLGIHLNNTISVPLVIGRLQKIPEIIEVNYTTGPYALIIKIMARDIDHYHELLVKKIQSMEEIRLTESFICLKAPISRTINPRSLKLKK